jgi:hypothetical protein
MTIAYLDPYKDDPYGKLKGNKADCWFKVNEEKHISKYRHLTLSTQRYTKRLNEILVWYGMT